MRESKIEWKALAVVTGAAYLVGWGLIGPGHGLGLAVIVGGIVVWNVKAGPTFWS